MKISKYVVLRTKRRPLRLPHFFGGVRVGDLVKNEGKRSCQKRRNSKAPRHQTNKNNERTTTRHENTLIFRKESGYGEQNIV